MRRIILLSLLFLPFLVFSQGNNKKSTINWISLENAKDLLAKALSMWIKYAQSSPIHSGDVIHLIKDSLFVLDRYSELESILKDLIERDSNNIDALINLANYYSNQKENDKSINLLDSLKESDKQSFLAKIARLKLRLNISENLEVDYHPVQLQRILLFQYLNHK